MDCFCKRGRKKLASIRIKVYTAISIDLADELHAGRRACAGRGEGRGFGWGEDRMSSQYLVFVGTLNREAPYFQGARGNGLVVYSFDEDTLAIEKLDEAPEIENPTFLSVDASGTYIYANSEIFGWKEGLVTAFRFDRQSSKLSYLNMQPSLGSITAHNTISRDNRKIVVATYSMGNGGPDPGVAV